MKFAVTGIMAACVAKMRHNVTFVCDMCDNMLQVEPSAVWMDIVPFHLSVKGGPVNPQLFRGGGPVVVVAFQSTDYKLCLRIFQ